MTADVRGTCAVVALVLALLGGPALAQVAEGVVVASPRSGLLRAQEAPERAARPGDLVELISPAVVHWEAKGRLLAVDGDTLWVARDTANEADVLRVSVDDVRRLRVHRGYGDARWRGVVLGAPLGFAAASVLNEARQPVGRTLESSWQVGGAVAGAVLGWTIGRFVPVDVWVEVDP